MKKLLFILLFTSISYSQSWKYNTFESDFDGSYKLARVYGTGGEFPYKNPDLVVLRYSTGSINIYISGAGYSGCDNKKVKFKFNNDDEIYTTSWVGSGTNNDSWFIKSMNDISEIQLLEKFTKHNSVSVRLISNCSSKDYKFSLSGSTKALDNVLGYGWFKKQFEKEEERIKKYKESKRKKEEEILKKYIENKELKRKRDSVKRVNDSLEKRKKEELKRKRDSIKGVNDSLEKRKKEEEVKLNRDKCRELKSSFTGYNYQCYTFYGKEIRKKMQDPESAIKVKKGTVLIIDKEFKNRVFYKVSMIDGLSKFTSYVFKTDVEITP
tara:strand:- start:1293 stop:2264 length:972 start_codon:yes stop_codon:yes gene_type:complete